MPSRCRSPLPIRARYTASRTASCSPMAASVTNRADGTHFDFGVRHLRRRDRRHDGDAGECRHHQRRRPCGRSRRLRQQPSDRRCRRGVRRRCRGGGRPPLNTIELASGAATGTITGLGTGQYQNFGSVSIDAGAAWDIVGTQAGIGAETFSGFHGSDTIDITDLGYILGRDSGARRQHRRAERPGARWLGARHGAARRRPAHGGLHREQRRQRRHEYRRLRQDRRNHRGVRRHHSRSGDLLQPAHRHPERIGRRHAQRDLSRRPGGAYGFTRGQPGHRPGHRRRRRDPAERRCRDQRSGRDDFRQARRRVHRRRRDRDGRERGDHHRRQGGSISAAHRRTG